jgi:hypothetical protein
VTAAAAATGVNSCHFPRACRGQGRPSPFTLSNHTEGGAVKSEKPLHTRCNSGAGGPRGLSMTRGHTHARRFRLLAKAGCGASRREPRGIYLICRRATPRSHRVARPQLQTTPLLSIIYPQDRNNTITASQGHKRWQKCQGKGGGQGHISRAGSQTIVHCAPFACGQL